MAEATAEVLDPKLKKLTRAIEDYFGVADMGKLRDMGADIFNPKKNLSQRKKAFATHKKTILALKPLFKQCVREQNKLAEKNGYKSRTDFINQHHGISKEKFKLFLKKVDLVITELNQKFPDLPQEAADWYWSEYNIPNAPGLATKKVYTVPDDILEMIKKKVPEVVTILPKIEIRGIEDFYPASRYDENKKKVIIFINPRRTRISGALTFIHEISHAVVDFDCLNKGIDPMGDSKYWNEKEAYKVESRLIKKLFPKKIHEAWLANFLNNITFTLFEYEIYNHPERNFDRAFARANNRCYLKANQRENPFYVLDSYLIARSGYSALASVPITELLLEKKI